MPFQTIEYVAFLAGIALLYRAVSTRRTLRTAVLVAASWAFYALGSGWYLCLLVALTGVDYVLVRAMGSAGGSRRKLLLAASVTLDLGALAAFKYAGFLSSALGDALGPLGLDVPPLSPGPAAPLGVSFWVFSSLTYTIDAYRGRCPPARSLLDYAAFVSFFPKVVAGPIARARQFLPQLDVPPAFGDADTGKALFLILAGMVKKIAIADFLARNLVDRVFDAPERFSSLEVLAGVYGFAMQIYCDFSGLTDIALGSALLLGFRLPLNFDLPYRATNLQDFWRRWHVSLSTWLRDYLYVPLGGSRRGGARTYANLLVVMLLGGLWHGAAWTFVVWGALHGAGLAVTRAARRWRAGRGPVRAHPLGRFAAAFVTFHFVAFAWIFFRAPSFGSARAILARISEGSGFAPNLTPVLLSVLLGSIVLHYLPRSWYARPAGLFVRAPAPAQAAVLLAAGFALARVATTVAPFIYEKF